MNTQEKAYRKTQDHWATVQSSLLLHESATEGIDVDRINAHFDEAGLEVKPLVFLDDEDYFHYYNFLEDSATILTSSGVYAPQIQTALVHRVLSSDSQHEAIRAETVAVHELAHSAHIESQTYVHHTEVGRIFKRGSATIHALRHGFSQPKNPIQEFSRGRFIEEGYAELERGIYVRNNDLEEQLLQGSQNFNDIRESAIPLHYWTQERPGWAKASIGAIGATVLELLTKEDPTLLDSLREGRSSANGLRDIAQKVNAIEPGLYQNMRIAQERSDFKALLSDVKTRF